MILIKVNSVPSTSELLQEKVENSSDGWRIDINRLYNQKKAITTYKGEILEEYEIVSYQEHPTNKDSVLFKLSKINNSELKGRIIKTRTANPCTILKELAFKEGN